MSKTATILAVPARLLKLCTTYLPIENEDQLHVLRSLPIWAGPRQELESDQMFRQIIPYVIVKTPRGILTYVRPETGGEDRLMHKASIGVGGHVDAADARFNKNRVIDFDKTLYAAMWRELDEEIGLTPEKINIPEGTPVNIKGLIVSSLTPTDRVHLGVVVVLSLTEEQTAMIRPNSEVGDLKYLSLHDLRAGVHGYDLESWSQIVITNLSD